jgi:ParB family chromosome partitioning protein
MLIHAVEAGRIPISVAVEIARGNDHEVQVALSEAYEKGALRGAKLASAKRIIMQRIAKQKKDGKASPNRKKLTGDALVREYRHQIRQQKNLVKKANATKDRLILLTSAIRGLMSDGHFVALLRAEQLADMPEQLAIRIK